MRGARASAGRAGCVHCRNCHILQQKKIFETVLLKIYLTYFCPPHLQGFQVTSQAGKESVLGGLEEGP